MLVPILTFYATRNNDMMRFLTIVTFALLPLSALANQVYFQSPSGNIYCEGGNGSVGCFIFETNQGANDGCAYIIESGAGKARRVCGADGSNDDEPVTTLHYGKSINGKGWTCTSQQVGMRCVNKAGKGFQLSRAKQSLF